MGMSANRVVSLCEQAAYILREDLNLIESGNLKLELFGWDVTDEHANRVRTRLLHLQEVVDGCGADCV